MAMVLSIRASSVLVACPAVHAARPLSKVGFPTRASRHALGLAVPHCPQNYALSSPVLGRGEFLMTYNRLGWAIPCRHMQMRSLSVLGHSEEANRDGRASAARVTKWGVATNVSLAMMKYFAGTLTASSALIADAAHSLSDLLTDMITLFVVDAARIPPDEDHPYGHGRFEAVGSLMVSIILAGTATGVGWSSFNVLAEWWTSGVIENGLTTSGYGAVAVLACVTSLISKEALYHATVRVGHDIGSPTLLANAWHHRSDALSSVAALLGVGGSLAGVPWLDPAAGILVSCLVAKAGLEIGWQALEEVTDKVDPSANTHVAVKEVAASIAGVLSIDRLRTRRMGPYLFVDVRIFVDPLISVSAARNVAEHLRREVHKAEPTVSEVLVHVTPYKDPPIAVGTNTLMRPHVELEREVRTSLEGSPGILGIARVITHYVPEEGIHLKVDIVCDFDITIREAREIALQAKLALESLPDVFSVDVDLDLKV